MKSYQKLFRSTYVDTLLKDLRDRGLFRSYLGNTFMHDASEVIEKTTVKSDSPVLLIPNDGNTYDLENGKIIFEAYRDMDPLDATDARMWTYLSHVTYWDYMCARRPIEKQQDNKKAEYIISHWFIDSLSPGKLLRQDIAMLWWNVYLTYDDSRKNPYELTEELFSMLDYTRHLLPGIQGRNRNFVYALLEFVIENNDLFSKYKESRVRFVMRRANYLAGYKNFTSLSKDDIKSIFAKYKNELGEIADPAETVDE